MGKVIAKHLIVPIPETGADVADCSTLYGAKILSRRSGPLHDFERARPARQICGGAPFRTQAHQFRSQL